VRTLCMAKLGVLGAKRQLSRAPVNDNRSAGGTQQVDPAT
jgi:hypothetical protein